MTPASILVRPLGRQPYEPVWRAMQAFTDKRGPETPDELCKHPRIIDLMSRQIEAATPTLAQFEKVKKFALLEREMSVEKGELTPTLKVKRRIVDEMYRDVIDRLYRDA